MRLLGRTIRLLDFVTMRSPYFCGVLLSFFQLKGNVIGDPMVHPAQAVAAEGDTLSFHCVIDSAVSSGLQTIVWIFTTERGNFLRPRYVYAFGRVFPEWRDRCNVTESANGHLTLTIRPVTSKDFGFFTCLDNRDDSKATAELQAIQDAASSSTSSTSIETTNIPRVTLEAEKQFGYKRSSDEATEEMLSAAERRTRSMSTVIVMCVFLIAVSVSAIIVLACVCVCLIRKRSSKPKAHGEYNDGFTDSQINRSPYLQTAMTNDTLYHQVTSYDQVPASSFPQVYR